MSFNFLGGSLPTGATLTRAGLGMRVNVSGVLVTESADVARFTYHPTTHAALGIIIEPAATNVLSQSQAINTSPWASAASATITADAVAAPDGNTTADLIKSSASNANQLFRQSPTLSAGTWTYSAFFKAKEYSRANLVAQADGSFPFTTFNLSTQAAVVTGSAITAAAIADYGGGWYRCSITYTVGAGSNVTYLGPSNVNAYAFTGDGISGGYAWQAQLEQGSVATSPIATTSSSASRAADVLTLDWASKGFADGSRKFVFTFDDGSKQTLAATIASGTTTVDPTALNRPIIADINAVATADASLTLGALTLSSAATAPAKAAASLTLGALTISTAGTEKIQAALATTLGSLTLSTTGALKLQAASSTALGAIVSTAAGSLRLQAGLTRTLGAIAMVSDARAPNGVLAPALNLIPHHGLSTNVPQAHPAQGTRKLLNLVAPSPGVLDNNQPITIRSVARTGAGGGSFADFYYNRIHIIPAQIDLGAVASSIQRPVSVWNAYFGDTIAQTVSGQQDGVAIVGIALPRTMKPLERLVFTAAVAVDGVPSIDADFSFTFDRGDVVRLNVIGTRARLWPFAPNWRDGVNVDLTYRTDLITSRSGREQRRALRNTPRKSIDYTVTLADAERQQFMQLVTRWQGKPMLVGDPTRSMRTTAGTPADGGVLTLDTVPYWVRVDAPIVVGDSELVIVTDIDPDTGIIGFTPANHDVLLPGTSVRPALTGRFTAQVTGTNPVSRVTEATITFQIEPGTEVIDQGTPSLYVLNGREMLPFRENWADAPQDSFEWPVEQVDYGQGVVATYQPISTGWVTRQQSYVGGTPEETAEIESFFHRMKGRQGEFYLPTGMEDLVLRSTAAQGTNFLRAAGSDIYDNFNNDPTYRAICILMVDGRRVLRPVNAMYVVSDGLGTDTMIDVGDDWLFDINPADVAKISWMPVFRFATDEIAFQWPTDGVAQVQLNMRSLEDLTVEDPLTALDGAAQWLLENWGEGGTAILDEFDRLVNIQYPEAVIS